MVICVEENHKQKLYIEDVYSSTRPSVGRYRYFLGIFRRLIKTDVNIEKVKGGGKSKLSVDPLSSKPAFTEPNKQRNWAKLFISRLTLPSCS